MSRKKNSVTSLRKRKTRRRTYTRTVFTKHEEKAFNIMVKATLGRKRPTPSEVVKLHSFFRKHY